MHYKKIAINFQKEDILRLSCRLSTQYESLYLYKGPNEYLLAVGENKKISENSTNYPKIIARKFHSKIFPNQDIWQNKATNLNYQPEYILYHSQEESFILSDNPAKAQEIKRLLEESTHSLPETPKISENISNIEYKKWKTNINNAKSLFQNKSLQKVVLARKKTFQCDAKAELMWPFLTSINMEHTHQFSFLHKNFLFFGFSPELLFSQNGSQISVPAIAGTRAITNCEKTNKELELELLNSTKEQTEHRLVVEFIKSKLEQTCSNIQQSKQTILRLSKVQHLYTNFTANINDASIDALIESLHPTPAMCGTPSLEAQNFLLQNENFNRGYFAAPIGFSLPELNIAKTIVCIRSALLHQQNLHVFAGAGILEDSDHDAEWLETEQKMKTILSLFDMQ